MALQLFLVLSQNWNQKFILLWLPIPLNVYLTLRAPALAHLPHTLAQIFIQFFFVSYNNLLLHEINKFFCKNKIYKHCTHYVSTYFPSKAIHISSKQLVVGCYQTNFISFFHIYIFVRLSCNHSISLLHTAKRNFLKLHFFFLLNRNDLTPTCARALLLKPEYICTKKKNLYQNGMQWNHQTSHKRNLWH